MQRESALVLNSPRALLGHTPKTVSHLQKNFLRALTEDPCNHLAYCNLGSTLTHQETIALHDGQICSRQDLFMKALEIEPLHATAYHNLGLSLNLYEEVSLPDGSASNKAGLFLKAVELEPNHAYALNDLAAIIDRDVRVQLADGAYDVIRLYSKAIKLQPKLAHAYANLGSILDVQEQVYLGQESAWGKEALLLEAIRLDGKIAHAYNGLGLMIGAGSEAKVRLPTGILWDKQELHMKAIELDPCIPSAWRGLADCLELTNYNVCLLDGSTWTRRQLLSQAMSLERRSWKARDRLTKERWPLPSFDTQSTTFTCLGPSAGQRQQLYVH